MAPRVLIVDGRMVIESTRHDTESYRRVEETGSRFNYNSYSNRAPAERWKTDETGVFCRALEQFGTDFELIQNQVKAKFKGERSNPRRVQDDPVASALAFTAAAAAAA